MLTVTRKLTIAWGDCDPAGIVYYPRYFEMFDGSTAGMFEALGYRKQQLQKTFDIVGIPMVETRANFRIPSAYGDDVAIETTIPEWGRTSFKVYHRLMKPGTDGNFTELAIEGFETRVWVGHDPDRRGGIKAKPLPTELFERFRHG